MTTGEARGWAAQAWCTPSNSKKEMDPDLADAFAEILVTRIEEDRLVQKIRAAREAFREAFDADPDYRRGYQANVAMLLHDRYGITGKVARNTAANDILNLIFDMKGEPVPT